VVSPSGQNRQKKQSGGPHWVEWRVLTIESPT